MQNYTISEMLTLPSLGKVYEYDVDPHIELRSMTTAEEMRRLSPANAGTYKSMCDIIDECMLNDPGISSYNMCLGDYIFLLYKLRIVTYGPIYKFESVCPFCGCMNDSSFNLDDLPVKVFDEENDKFKQVTLSNGSIIDLNYQTPAMLDRINEQAKERRKKAAEDAVDTTLLLTLKNIINTVDGKKPNPVNIDNWIRNLPMKDTNAILNYASKLNDSIGIDMALQNDCVICGLTYDLTLSITNEFFRPALDI